ncbi:hypothetical protein B1748_26205 [Paenibacillus sp. MY03]|uniref:DUF3243 domain-containing protein n=1 Tax=Paenibacillus agaridevorans TaxID=171404 RepID=A0A2R5ESJ7_9BACL|nr:MULTISPECIES: DUF3243 domain-containing protein [Paenibacillus]OUS71645.1 hypothetical protein B1748_26205 [Paenibacillus sp. MY03]QNK54823.1 DUF3243 domain-containing protein [Paenibacillus sp. PAMC21692]GBG09662.1 hypothetical protein PAT3040_04320 [Paenibacillus agaridevorans]
MSTVLSNFDTWKHFLSDRVTQAKKMGLTEDTIANLAYEIGSFLDEKVDPKNDEESVLKQLWDVGDESERKAIASCMVKLVEHS